MESQILDTSPLLDTSTPTSVSESIPMEISPSSSSPSEEGAESNMGPVDMVLDTSSTSQETQALKNNEQQETQTTEQPKPEGGVWNANDIFQFGFQFTSPADEEETSSLLDEDAKNILLNSGGEDYLDRVKELIVKFLALESPKLTEQMTDFFFLEGVLDLFLSFFIRLDIHSCRKMEWNRITPEEFSLFSLRKRENESNDPQRLSFQTVDVITGSNSPNIRLLDSKLRDIVIKTFDIFHPDSNANFFHFQKLFDHLLQHDPNSVLELIFLPLPETGSVPEGTSTDSLQEPTMQRPLIFRTLPYLYEAPVMAVVLSCLFRLKSDRESPITQKLRYIMLQNEQFLEYIVSFLLLPDPKLENAILGSADLLVRMIEEAIFIDHTHILFLSLITTTDPSVSGSRTLQSQGALNVSSSRIPPVNHSNASINSYSAEFTVPIILDALLGRLVNESTPVFQQRAIIEVLHAFTVKALARPMRPVSMEELNAGSMVGSGGNSLNSLSSLVADDDVPDDVANEMNLLNIASGVCHFLAVRMDVVCNVLLQIHKQYTLNQKNPDCIIKFSSYTVSAPLGSAGILFMEVFNEVLKMAATETPETVENIAHGIWKILVDWFFELRYNNTYHGLFYRVMSTLLRLPSRVCMRNFIIRTKLIPRLVEHFTKVKDTGLRGHIILVCNCLRLTSEEQAKNEYLPQLLRSTPEWKDFWSILKQATLGQIISPPAFQIADRTRVIPHFGPDCIMLEPPDSTECLGPKRPIDPDDDLGVHLGSTYALSLGFLTPKQEGSRSPELERFVSKRDRKKSRIEKQKASQVVLPNVEDENDSSDEEGEISETVILDLAGALSPLSVNDPVSPSSDDSTGILEAQLKRAEFKIEIETPSPSATPNVMSNRSLNE